MTSIARIWFERGLVADWLGMWWVHALVVAVALLLLARDTGWTVWSRAPRVVVAT
jgi:hypothetical protein